MEIMFAVLFFSIASAVCLQLFAKAHTLSEDTVLLDRAVNICQSAASVLSAGDMDTLSEHFDGQWQGDTYIIPFYSEKGTHFLCVSEDDDSYDLKVPDVTPGANLYTLHIVKQIP